MSRPSSADEHFSRNAARRRKIGERYRRGRNGVDSKSTCPVKSRARGFESHPLRHQEITRKRRVNHSACFRRRDAREAEGARLEIVCTPKRCTEGSNPSLSATLPLTPLCRNLPMSYLVLARKWRPQTFAEVIGQPHVTRTLQNAISKNRIAHAYLFCGARGVGKTSVARILAKTLNCLAPACLRSLQ